MRLRGMIGLFVTVTMAHIAVVGSDPVCAKHSGAQVAQLDDVMPRMDHGQHAGQPTGTVPCKTPARTDCCQSVASCTTSVAVASVIAIDDAPLMPSSMPGSIDDIPLSRIAAPEPPPPKG